MSTNLDREPIRIGLLSQDVKLMSVLSSTLGREFLVLTASDAERAKEMVTGSLCNALILDADCGFCSGEAYYDEILSGEAPVIVMADDKDRQKALQLVERGAHSYARKPPVIPELRNVLRRAYDGRLLKGELDSARRQLEKLIGLDQLAGSSACMQAVYDLIRRVTNLDAPILVTGESGTGKELVAQAIHNIGNRSKRPFVALACGAIPETLIEAELFGHEKGAFTGTVGVREGYLEKAGDGTLFLDEIGELSLQTQVKLLRVLQQREFSRLGSSRLIPVRARIILATHRDLGQMVTEGKFRQDLYYRINVVNIRTPALRLHMEDICLLAQHFLQRYSQMYRKPVETIDPEALLLLENYSWPGNVRELENVIQRAIIIADGDSIRTADLPETLQELEVSEFDEGLPASTFERLLHDYKVKLAKEAIAQCNGNKTLAAQSLSISRAYLHRLIRLSPLTVEIPRTIEAAAS
jgi:DNA-binding NtrC family response regulator